MLITYFKITIHFNFRTLNEQLIKLEVEPVTYSFFLLLLFQIMS